MTGKRFSKGKHRRGDKAAINKFDPSPLIGDVNLDNKDVQIYLVKMPEQLVRHFEDPSAGIVGRLRIADPSATTANTPKKSPEDANHTPASTTKTKPATSKIFIDKPAATANGDAKSRNMISTEFDLQLQQQNPNILVFSADADKDDADDVRIEGVVSYQCQARPAMTEAFRRMNSHRSYTMNRSVSRLQVMDEHQRKAADRAALRPTAMMETAKEREERRRQKEEARRHLDVPDEVWQKVTRVHIFKAFNIQPYYTAEELANTIRETASRIRPILSDVCMYNKAGPSAGKYELKDEYKTVDQRQKKDRELAEYQRTQAENAKKRKEERAEREKEDLPRTKKARHG